MATVLLVRHGRTDANANGILAGWTPGVELDQVGREQAQHMADRLAELPVRWIVTSPLTRTSQTAAVIGARHEAPVIEDLDLGECRYGDWTGRPLRDLAQDPLWDVVLRQPSAAAFPGGESISEMATRAGAACRGWAAKAEAEFGPDAMVVVVTHGDIIKAALADALGLHLDLFQRIVVYPGSLSVIRYSTHRPMVERMNDTGSAPPPVSHPSATAASSGTAAASNGSGRETTGSVGGEPGPLQRR